jgi:hypothetical protein
MSEVKEVTVTLSEADEKALTGKKSRRARRMKGGSTTTEPTPESGAVRDAGGPLSPSEAAVLEPSTRVTKVEGPPTGIEASLPSASSLSGSTPLKGGSRVTSEPISPLATGLSITPPAIVMPTLSPTTTVGGAVTIGGKKSTADVTKSTVNTVPTSGGATKIIPTKRRFSAAPAAQTLKKPKFHVGGAGAQVPPVPGTLPPRADGVSKTGGGSGGAAPAAKQTRRFKERRIRLTVKSSRQSRQVRKGVKARIRAMPVSEVRQLLLKKNIIKAAAAMKLPEDMLRNMLCDYMLLHSAD